MSMYRGIVTDTADPEGLLRIKAQVPILYGQGESDWMWPSIPIAMGVQVPDVGDPVWVMLEGGDRERPVWVGTWRTRPQGGLDPDLIFGGVVAETSYGLASSNGLAYTVSRSDHTHGSPSLTSTAPVAEAFGDTAVVGVGTTPARHDHRHAMPADPVPPHVAMADPHTQYQRESEKGAANGYASLDANTRVPQAQIASGTASAGRVPASDGVGGTAWTDIATQVELDAEMKATNRAVGSLYLKLKERRRYSARVFANMTFR